MMKVSHYSTKQLIKLISTIIIIMVLFYIWLYSADIAINVPTFHIDGAFQTASGLYRINAGYIIGKNYLPYLGVGPILILYPLFKLMGANITASVFSSYYMTLTIGWLNVVIMIKLFFPSKSLLESFTLGSIIFFFFFLALSRSPYLVSFSFYESPGYSLKPIRAFAPYVFTILLYYFVLIKNYRLWFTEPLIAAIIVGISLLWSNDYSYITCLLLSFFYISNLFFTNHSYKKILLFLFSVPVIWMCLLFFISHGHPDIMLKYNFLDVAYDQWWYFMSPKDKILSWQDLSKLLFIENYLSLYMLLGFIIIGFFTKRVHFFLISIIGIILYCGGLLACIGGSVSIDYFVAFQFWGTISSIILAIGLPFKLAQIWQVASGKWQVASGKWQVASGKWQVA